MKQKLLLILSIFLLTVNVYARDAIEKMNIDIFIDDEGNANITEVWNTHIDNSSDYTEWYKQYFNLGNSEISDLKVNLNGIDYVTIDDWDVSSSFAAKSYKAGINYVSSGNEICWGMTNYGTNTYIISYKISNFVNKINDSELTYWAIVPQEFDFPIDDIYVKIHSNFAYADSLDVWGYGYNGYAYVYDGYIELTTEHGLNADEYMVVLIKFPEGTFNPASSIENDFGYYLDLAQEGASPTGPSLIDKIFGIISSLISFAFVSTFIFFIVKAIADSENKLGTKRLDYKDAPKKLPKDADIHAFRDIPCDHNIIKSYWVCGAYKLFKNKTDFLGALLLKWIYENRIEVIKKQSKVLKKEETSLVLKNDKPFDNFYEEEMYNWMKSASTDGILEKNEFKKYCNKHYDSILKWFDEIFDDTTDKLVEENQILALKHNKYTLRPVLREEAIKLKGLKKFLIEFTNIKSKEAIEVKLLNEYLMHAQLFGIAKKVAKQFKELYPDLITDDSYTSVIFINDFSTTSVSAATAAHSRANSYSAGGGGFSSFGGGGGSFGGGGGGGAR